MSKLIHVAAAAIFNPAGELLLALRDTQQHQGGLWEFPGGKVEEGESARDALARELAEELGIEIDQAATMPLIQVPYHYPDKSVLLDVFRVNGFSGTAYGREGQPLKWIQLAELTDYQFPAANKPIVNALLLPNRIAITPELPCEQYTSFVEQALQQGADKVMLRAKHLSDAVQRSLYTQLATTFEGLIIWNTSLEEANAFHASAVHLSSDRLQQLDNQGLQRRELFTGRWLGASCHSIEQIRQAERVEVDYITLSPVQPTRSHPHTPPLGWDEFRRLVSETRVPVYALGGVSLEHLATTIDAGGQGIAAISGFQPPVGAT
ncbi:Nudix family hydrolase [Amphritea sp. 1_MG-2023]|uniref:Nudix family hydrolase n=1 Tax=Amphritea sp. 1_MG-2023 TaxID=3062670 RepID=UPI0026E37627|nr:Nudix family hydrolase [Amphritea sp. 1_MG-2023]MDO6562896.1 Nudix family hydrolase [Amphritea sp. 1_MG-2023]